MNHGKILEFQNVTNQNSRDITRMYTTTYSLSDTLNGNADVILIH